jgi:D-sedoheptulose 7-phosphate isomerase
MTTKTDAQSVEGERALVAPPALPPIEDWEAIAAERFAEAEHNFRSLAADVTQVIAATRLLHTCLQRGNKVLFCGNGGSAGDAQHLSTELMGRFLRDRRPLPAVALTVDTSALTAIGNDYGFDQVFARQLRGIGAAGDVLVGISTSGNSRNVVAAFETARQMGIATVALVGRDGGLLEPLADAVVNAPSTSTPRIQELHIAIGQTMCELLEGALT